MEALAIMIFLGVVGVMALLFMIGWYMRGEVEGLNVPRDVDVNIVYTPRPPECDKYVRGGGKLTTPLPPRNPTMPSESPKEV